MKILQVKIYSPDLELLREVKFKEIGLSIIYGNVEKPNNATLAIFFAKIVGDSFVVKDTNNG